MSALTDSDVETLLEIRRALPFVDPIEPCEPNPLIFMNRALYGSPTSVEALRIALEVAPETEVRFDFMHRLPAVLTGMPIIVSPSLGEWEMR